MMRQLPADAGGPLACDARGSRAIGCWLTAAALHRWSTIRFRGRYLDERSLADRRWLRTVLAVRSTACQRPASHFALHGNGG
jgi:hypothetical protein